MASFKCISSVGKSIERLLQAAFEQEQPIDAAHPTRAVLARSEDFARGESSSALPGRALAVFLYRVEVNHVVRAAFAHDALYAGRAQLPIDLHYLLIPFADNAEWEQQIAGRTLQCLEETPSLSGPLLLPTAVGARGGESSSSSTSSASIR